MFEVVLRVALRLFCCFEEVVLRLYRVLLQEIF